MPAPVESFPDIIRAEVESALAQIPFRTPILDDDEPGINSARTDARWAALTEATRRSILSNPDARHAAASFAGAPLSEALPGQFIDELDDKVARIARLSKSMGKILGLASVPDEVITPDLRNPIPLRRGEDEIDGLTRRKQNFPESFDGTIERTRISVEKYPGITLAEKNLVARRYRYARDAKLLSLMAEIHDQPIENLGTSNGLITHRLPSGTELTIASDAYESTPALLDPKKWERRQQIKDRVYAIQIDGDDYIMKERKTLRHTDTLKNGYKDGLTSKQEFEVAMEFAGLGTMRQGDIQLHWERPLGYVEFPDGYQFAVFEGEPDLCTENPKPAVVAEILANPDEYREEFDQISQAAKVIYAERGDLLRGFDREDASRPRLFELIKAVGRRKDRSGDLPKHNELTFKEFATLKATYLINEAEDLLNTTMLKKGYINGDINGCAFRVIPGLRLTVQIIGLDFEYYTKDPQYADLTIQTIDKNMQNGNGARMRSYEVDGTRAIMVAASYAMLEHMGYKLPIQKTN